MNHWLGRLVNLARCGIQGHWKPGTTTGADLSRLSLLYIRIPTGQRRRYALRVDAFHHGWNYDMLNFNCEYFARLMSTGTAHCWQVIDGKKKYPLGSIRGGWIATGRNDHAQKVIHDNIEKYV